jgi:hypothetical protein
MSPWKPNPSELGRPEGVESEWSSAGAIDVHSETVVEAHAMLYPMGVRLTECGQRGILMAVRIDRHIPLVKSARSVSDRGERTARCL